jgi:cell division transport system permease protein
LSRLGLKKRAPLAPPTQAGRLVAFVAAAMCFLATLALAANVVAGRVAGAWEGRLAESATVRIPAPEGRDAARPLVDAALSALDGSGLAGATVLSAAETAALTAPWLGPGVDAAALPLPVLIAVTPGPRAPSAETVRAALAASAPGAVYDDHGVWRARLQGAADRLAAIAGWSAALAFATLAAMVAVATRASLAAAAGTARTLRLLGAEDMKIAAMFDRPLAVAALTGGAVGSAAAALVLVSAPAEGLADGLGIAPDPAAGAGLWAALAAPLAACAVAYATALGSTLLLLRRTR